MNFNHNITSWSTSDFKLLSRWCQIFRNNIRPSLQQWLRVTVSTSHRQIPSGLQGKLMSWTICCRRKACSLTVLTFSPAPKEEGTRGWVLAASAALLWTATKGSVCWGSKAACSTAAVGTVCHGRTQAWIFTTYLQRPDLLWCAASSSRREAFNPITLWSWLLAGKSHYSVICD